MIIISNEILIEIYLFNFDLLDRYKEYTRIYFRWKFNNLNYEMIKFDFDLKKIKYKCVKFDGAII